MRTIFRISTVFFLSLLLANCSSSDDGEDDAASTFIPPILTTLPVESGQGSVVTLNANVSFAGNGMVSRGFCISTEINPMVNASSLVTYDNGTTGSFSETINTLEPNTTYHVRAYASTYFNLASSYTYGNDVTFTTGFPIQALPTINISTNKATFRINVLNVTDSVDEMGVCYGTLQNPTTSNSERLQFSETPGLHQGSNNTFLDAMTPNTVYYVRPYYISNGDSYYGEQTTFRTTGYFGQGGGYVAFDKGEMTDGWRYLEVSPTTLQFGGSSLQWGCHNSFITNTYPEMGTGLANTSTIVSGCSANNCAARACNNLVLGGKSDWYLGSRDEMLNIAQSLDEINVTINDCWTSTETTGSQAYYITLNSSNNIIYSLIPKNYGFNVYPVRRY